MHPINWQGEGSLPTSLDGLSRLGVGYPWRGCTDILVNQEYIAFEMDAAISTCLLPGMANEVNLCGVT
jgi:hypothetical protein